MSQVPRIAAAFNYLAPIARLTPPEPPFRYAYAPPKGRPLHNEVLDSHQCLLNDIRDSRHVIGLDSSGFDSWHGVPSIVKDWSNNEVVVRDYYPEVAKLLEERLGAHRVHIFDHTLRRREPDNDKKEDVPGKRQPVLRVHIDQTPLAGENRVKMLLGDIEGAKALEKRVQIINVWRPLLGPVMDAPLGMIDARSVDWDADGVVGKILYRDRCDIWLTVGESTSYTFLVRHNPDHKWYYLSNMMPDEALLIKCYDNKLPQTVAAHSGFVLANGLGHKPPRQSIELRAMVFYDN